MNTQDGTSGWLPRCLVLTAWWPLQHDHWAQCCYWAQWTLPENRSWIPKNGWRDAIVNFQFSSVHQWMTQLRVPDLHWHDKNRSVKAYVKKLLENPQLFYTEDSLKVCFVILLVWSATRSSTIRRRASTHPEPPAVSTSSSRQQERHIGQTDRQTDNTGMKQQEPAILTVVATEVLWGVHEGSSLDT